MVWCTCQAGHFLLWCVILSGEHPLNQRTFELHFFYFTVGSGLIAGYSELKSGNIYQVDKPLRHALFPSYHGPWMLHADLYFEVATLTWKFHSADWLGAGDAIWWWILKRSRQPLQRKAIPLGYMLSKMHLIMFLSLWLCASLLHLFPLCPFVEHWCILSLSLLTEFRVSVMTEFMNSSCFWCLFLSHICILEVFIITVPTAGNSLSITKSFHTHLQI